jgi:hypothetical protein
MRFYSKYDRIEYVVIAKQHETVGTHRRTTRGLTAKFHNHYFDSEVAAKDLQWSEEDRKTVERHLLEHGDMGIHLYVATDKPKDAPIDTELQPLTRCIATVATADGSQLCGEPALDGKDLCEIHQKEFEAAMAGVEELKEEKV